MISRKTNQNTKNEIPKTLISWIDKKKTQLIIKQNVNPDDNNLKNNKETIILGYILILYTIRAYKIMSYLFMSEAGIPTCQSINIEEKQNSKTITIRYFCSPTGDRFQLTFIRTDNTCSLQSGQLYGMKDKRRIKFPSERVINFAISHPLTNQDKAEHILAFFKRLSYFTRQLNAPILTNRYTLPSIITTILTPPNIAFNAHMYWLNRCLNIRRNTPDDNHWVKQSNEAVDYAKNLNKHYKVGYSKINEESILFDLNQLLERAHDSDITRNKIMIHGIEVNSNIDEEDKILKFKNCIISMEMDKLIKAEFIMKMEQSSLMIHNFALFACLSENFNLIKGFYVQGEKFPTVCINIVPAACNYVHFQITTLCYRYLDTKTMQNVEENNIDKPFIAVHTLVSLYVENNKLKLKSPVMMLQVREDHTQNLNLSTSQTEKELNKFCKELFNVAIEKTKKDFERRAK